MQHDGTLRIEDYPTLRLLCWSWHDATIPRREAFGLYEREWRFVDSDALEPHEARLIASLADEFGEGVLNV